MINLGNHIEYLKPIDYINKNGRGITFWFTGLSGSGKSTLISMVEKYLFSNFNIKVLDGDIIRLGLCNNLGFSPQDRTENLRRSAETCKLFNDIGVIVLAGFISPNKEDRLMVKSIIGENNFSQIWLEIDIKDLIKRDPKGLYSKALNGEIKGFTGIDSPFDDCDEADIILNTTEDINITYKNLIKFIDLKLNERN